LSKSKPLPIDILEEIIYNTATIPQPEMDVSMKRRILFLLLGLAIGTTLCSCIGIESRIDLKSDGSGTLTLNYKISQFMKNIDVGREDKRLPLPVSEEDFRRTADGIAGLRLVDLEEREDEENVYIRAVLAFDDLEALNALGPEPGLGLSLIASGGERILRQEIAPGLQPGEISDDSLAMITEFFDGYELAYKIAVPAPIKRHNLGELSQDGRSLTYTATVPQLMQAAAPVILEVVW
jgi:hypothetical protein